MTGLLLKVLIVILVTLAIGYLLLEFVRGSLPGNRTDAANDKPRPLPEDRSPAAAPPQAEGTADDLKRISGIGPKLESKLNDLGISSLTQVAALSADDIERIDTQLRFKGRIQRDEWVAQARALLDQQATSA